MIMKCDVASRSSKYNIDWPSLVFAAYADKEPFVDVEVVTLQQHCIDLIVPEAIEYCAEQNIDLPTVDQINAFIKANNFSIFRAREFISCHYSDISNELRVVVGVNAPEVSDDVVDYGMQLLTKISRFYPGLYEEFGPEYTFHPETILK